jgi:hypothetical protein
MAVKKTTGLQKHVTLYDIKLIKEKFPDLIIINNQKTIHFINGPEVLYLSVYKNYTHANLINKRSVIITKPMKEVCPLFDKYVVCMGNGLALNFSRIVEVSKKNHKILFDDTSFLILKQKEGKTFCEIVRGYYK